MKNGGRDRGRGEVDGWMGGWRDGWEAPVNGAADEDIGNVCT